MIKKLFKDYVCTDMSNPFQDLKQHMVELPYEKDFDEINIPTKACPVQMNKELLELWKKNLIIFVRRKYYETFKISLELCTLLCQQLS